MAAFDGAPGRALDGVKLAPPGTITGVLAPTEGTTDTSLWIGIPGTDIYRKPGPAESGGRPFTLPDVPAGAYFLESLTARDPGQGSRYKTEPIQVRSGETIDLGGFP